MDAVHTRPEARSQQERWRKYLEDRLIGESLVTIGSVDTIQRVQVSREVSRWGAGIWPRPEVYARVVTVTAAASIALGVALPVSSLVLDTVDELRNGIDAISDRVFGLPEHEVTRTHIVLKEEKHQQTISVEDEVTRDLGRQSFNAEGEFTPDPALISQITSELAAITRDRGTILAVEVRGTSSDEWGNPDVSLGRSNPGNIDLARQRAQQFVDALNQAAQTSNIVLPAITSTGQESVLTDSDRIALEGLRDQGGYESLSYMLNLYAESPDELSPPARDFLDVRFGEKRGVTIAVSYLTIEERLQEVTVVVPVEVTERTKVKEPYDVVPVDHDHDYDFNPIWLIPPPLPLLRRRKESVSEEQDVIISEPIDESVWVKLYPEALNGRTLDRDAWSLTRKYQYLLREDRIGSVLQCDFTDDSGKAQNIRVAFIDHTPSPHTVKAVEGLLEDICQMNGGRVPTKLGLIAIYPDGSAGHQSNPEIIGMGIDEQYDAATLGVAIPALGLVELHMDPHATPSELRSFNGMRWTLAHEVAGHFTDVVQDTTRLRPVINVPNGYLTSNPWLDRGLSMSVALSGPRSDKKWIITTPFFDGEGHLQIETIETDRLPEAFSIHGVIRKEGFPTQYGSPLPQRSAHTDRAELYAEVAAQITTGQPIPFSESPPVFPVPETTASEHDGYHVDSRLHSEYALAIGANPLESPTARPLRWGRRRGAPTFTLSAVEENPDFALMASTAKARDLPQDEELVNILAGVRNSQARTGSRAAPGNSRGLSR